MQTDILFYYDAEAAPGAKMRPAMFSKLYMICGRGSPRKLKEAKIRLIATANFTFM